MRTPSCRKIRGTHSELVGVLVVGWKINKTSEQQKNIAIGDV